MKAFEENDYEIESLKNHIESRDAVESSHIHTVKNTDKGKAVMHESNHKFDLNCIVVCSTVAEDDCKLH